MKNIVKSQSGMAAIIIVVVIGATALVLAKSASLSGINEIDISFNKDQGEKALSLAEGCAEETLRRIQLDTSYIAADLELTYGGGYCIINTEANGSQRTITINSQVGDYFKKLEVEAELEENRIIINNWQEVSN
ncbi:hypothetical protein DRH27_01950 [Candidatus Falkowbacteria bacterium]|nr:MAG: hypothetical protein DRH27_01950 [Candidatus Falkowbacteria bacterium]